MRRLTGIILAAAALTLVGTSTQAAFFGLPRGLKDQIERIRFEAPALAPIAFTRFCLQFPDECRVRHTAFRPHPVALTADSAKDLFEVNRGVNRAIAPRRDPGGVADEHWRVAPRAGACHDYAVTKRHELLQRGWPSRALLLAEVVVRSGEHHLVLVVRTDEGDLVLDNIAPQIRPWSHTPYQWLRIQSPANPNFWSAVGRVVA